MAHSVLVRAGQAEEGEIRSHSTLITSPGPYVRAGDFIRLNATSSNASATLRLTMRLIPVDGSVVDAQQDMVIVAAGNQTAVTLPLMDGWLDGIDVQVVAGTITAGEITATVDVVQGTGAGATPIMCLASGEVSNTRRLGLGAYPVSIQPPTTLVLIGSTPAVGAEISFAIPAGPRVRLWIFEYNFVTALVAGTRTSILVLTKSATQIAFFMPSQTQITNVNAFYTWANFGTPSVLSTNRVECCLPPLPILDPGDTLTTQTTNINGGDQYQAPQVLVEPIR